MFVRKSQTPPGGGGGQWQSVAAEAWLAGLWMEWARLHSELFIQSCTQMIFCKRTDKSTSHSFEIKSALCTQFVVEFLQKSIWQKSRTNVRYVEWESRPDRVDLISGEARSLSRLLPQPEEEGGKMERDVKTEKEEEGRHKKEKRPLPPISLWGKKTE